MITTIRWTHVAFLLWFVAGPAATLPLVAQGTGPPAAELDLPARIPLELDFDETGRFSLSRIGPCCFQREFTEDPPKRARVVPAALGAHRVFTVLDLADSEIVMSFEDLDQGRQSGGRLLVRADLDQDGDLTDDPVHHCRRHSPCGPFEVVLHHGEGSASYALNIQFFATGDDSENRNMLWYWRGVALTGTFAGRAIAVIDDDTSGRYDDPEDVVVFDLDGDGRLDGGYDGRERLRRDESFRWAGETFVVTDVDPVARTMEVDRAPTVTRVHRVLDVQSAKPVAGARVTTYPGPHSSVTDATDRARVERPGGRLDFLTAVADGYWSAVYGPGQRAGEDSERILLERGPCRQPAVRWCGRESLGASSTTNSHVDLDSGVVGPRVGETPGPKDVGWYIPPGGFYLSAFDEAGLAVLGSVDFDGLTPADLRALTFDEERVYGGAGCGRRPAEGRDAPIGPGTVLGVRTQEGRLGKIRIDECGYRLDLSWVIYDEGAAEDAAQPERAELTLVSKTPIKTPIQVGGQVVPPVRIYAPNPQYTGRARQARLQGVVIVQTVIDKEGHVTSAKVLKGLGMGLDESAAKTLRKWRFEPATLHGEPVAVYYNLTVTFRLQ